MFLHTASDRRPNPLSRWGGHLGLVPVVVLVLCGARLALGVPWARHAAQDGDHERWYVIEMGGQRAGWAMSSQATEPDKVVTRSSIRFEIRRGEVGVAISMEGEFVETPAGKPVSMTMSQQLGAGPVTMTAAFKDDGIDVAERGPGGEKRSTHPLPEGAWLPPAAAASYVRQRLAAGAERIEVRTIDAMGSLTVAEALRPVTITRTDFRPDAVRAMGKDVPGTRCLSVNSAQPMVKATEWIDDEAVPIRVESALGGISLVMTAADRSEATARHVAPEFMVRTFVRPDRAIDGARAARRAAYVLSLDDGDLPDPPATGVQRVERLGPGSARLTIDLDRPSDAGDAEEPALLADSPLIDAGDERVRALAARAVREAGAGPPTPAARAEVMRRFVHRYITGKNLDVGFAGAAEVARTRAGDCTEHSVLLAAMLRAEGIPSRVAAGLVYADEFAGERGVFAYHMWTQAALEADGKPRWVDLDATMPEDAPMDATHLALAVSALGGDDVQNVFLSLASLLGRLSIAVEQAPQPP